MTYLAQKTKDFFLVLFLTCLMLSQAMAADKIGAIAAVIGKVTIERDGEIISVKPGSPVFENDKIMTGGSSRAQVLLMDQTAINVGQKAEIVLDKFVFNSDDDEVALKVTKGTFKFISGKVATKNPEKVNVETPVATIGVRGTEFVGQISASDSTIALLDGKILVANDLSTQFVTNPGFGVTIDTAGVISTPVKIPQAQLEAVLNSVSTDREALLEEDIEGGLDPEGGPDDEGGLGPDGEFGPDDEGGPGRDDEGGPGPDDEFRSGPDGEFGPGSDGGFGPSPNGDLDPGPEFDPFGPGPESEAAIAPIFSTALALFDEFEPGSGGPPPIDLSYASDLNMAPQGAFILYEDLFGGDGARDPFSSVFPGSDQFEPDEIFDQFGSGLGEPDGIAGVADIIQDGQFLELQQGEEFITLFNEVFGVDFDEFAAGGIPILPLSVTLQRFTINEGLPSQLIAVRTGLAQGPTTITLSSGVGDDSDLFSIDSGTGEITFASITPANAFNFENPQDGGNDNIFNITLSITDGVSSTARSISFQIEDLPVLKASDFQDNFQNINPVFQSFGGQEAFLNALTDGTLTWDPDFSGGALTFSGGSSAPTISLTDVVLLYKTLGHTVSLDMAGTFSGVDIGSNVFTSGTIAVDINDRSVSQFTSPGSFNFSSVASGSALTIIGGETLSLTATQSASGRDMAGASSISATDITTTVTNFTAGAEIGVGTGAPLAASALIQITDVNGANGGGSVGLGRPTITNQQSQTDN